MSNRLSLLFDRKPRHSKSISNLDISTESLLRSSQQTQKPKTYRGRDTLTVMHEYNFGRPLPPLPPQPTQSSSRSAKATPRISQARAATAPMLHPPDELYLKMIRRRSASAVLEDTQAWLRDDREDQDIASRLAFASALPPIYFDQPPDYTEYTAYSVHANPKHDQLQRGRTSGVTQAGSRSKAVHDELFLTIDETIASFKMTVPTPLASPQRFEHVVSPMNDIDRIYLERTQRKQRGRR